MYYNKNIIFRLQKLRLSEEKMAKIQEEVMSFEASVADDEKTEEGEKGKNGEDGTRQ